MPVPPVCVLLPAALSPATSLRRRNRSWETLPSAHPNRQLHAAHPPPKRAERRATSDQPVDCVRVCDHPCGHPADARRPGTAPLAPAAANGQTATPAFEGWYRNPDGTFSLSFGYYNRNTTEVLSVPIGPDNFVSPGDPNQGQPTLLLSATTLGRVRGEGAGGFRRPEESRLDGEDSRTRRSRFPAACAKNGRSTRSRAKRAPTTRRQCSTSTKADRRRAGPAGITVERIGDRRQAAHAQPLLRRTMARVGALTRGGAPVTLTWFTHQGPAQATFAPPTARLTPTGGTSTHDGDLQQAGRLHPSRARDTIPMMVAAGHSQCCWTNAFVKVRVTP